jgi:hypothetical protein
LSTDPILVAVLLLGIAAVVAAVGIAIGMLVAPAIGRLGEPHDEETGGDD